MPNELSKRLPAEWEAQSAVMLTWAHQHSDWGDTLADVDTCLCEIAYHISLREKCLITAYDTTHRSHILKLLTQRKAKLNNIVVHCVKSNDVWVRDHGPITILQDDKPMLMDFTFNGWGNKHKSDLDNAITRHLYEAGVFNNATLKSESFVLEGGSIESDGEGTLLTTAQCLLSPQRNPRYTKAQIEQKLKSEFNAHTVHWLEHGHLIGDDTDGHIDTLARFVNNHTIAYVGCDNRHDPHHASLSAMHEELLQLRTPHGAPYELLRLPLPEPMFDQDGDQLPATYANFLFINEAVLLPVYNQPRDEKVHSILSEAFQNRAVIPIDCRALVFQYGSLHCATMQLPNAIDIA